MSLSYRTLTICRAGLDLPFNDWKDAHIRQGFSWRPESVSFRTLEPEESSDEVVVDLRASYIPAPAARRILKVPFNVGDAGVEVTSPVSDSWAVAIPLGHYALFFAVVPSDVPEQAERGAWGYHLTFVPAPVSVEAEVLRADEELDPPRALLMEAQPAI